MFWLRRHPLPTLVTSFVAFALGLSALADDARPHAVVASRGMVVAEEAKATWIGVEVLKRGGNAVDAAVAVGFALAVTLPQAGNIGGGGFMLLHLAARNQTIAIDYRESAPLSITRGSFLNDKGEADPAKSRDSALAVGVPGSVAGLALAHQRYGSGKFTLAELIAPAIRLAREGFIVEDALADSLVRGQSRLSRWPASAKIFLKADGSPLGRGDRLVQGDLAATLEEIARSGPNAFYSGAIAEKIIASLRQAGGVMTRDDLTGYRAVERAPVRGTYRGFDVASMPPPSAGGALLVEMLNILEGYRLRKLGPASKQSTHILVETMKLAHADRAEYLGDPEVVDVPIKGITSKRYAAELRSKIDPNRARPSREIRPGNPTVFESGNTTHFSIIDRDGNVVANTYTLNFSYGLGLVAEGTGILLNNELDDFAAKPGAPNAFGLVGGAANAPGPRKRPLSSMTPTIVFKDGKPLLVTGSPGGSRIINTVLQVIINVIDFRLSIADAVAAPRVHHQWMPDEVVVEPSLSQEITRELAARGHTIGVRPRLGAANSILLTPRNITAVADPRVPGGLAAGY